MVGLAGFEPTASCTPCRRATRLRHSPNLRRDLIASMAWHLQVLVSMKINTHSTDSALTGRNICFHRDTLRAGCPTGHRRAVGSQASLPLDPPATETSQQSTSEDQTSGCRLRHWLEVVFQSLKAYGVSHSEAVHIGGVKMNPAVDPAYP